jgi:GWxTD domain-containing protein
MTVTNLQSGKYLYRVRILDGGMNEIIAIQKNFFANNPHIATTANPISIKAAEFLGMSFDELSKEFRTAQYLANDQEIKSFSEITTTEGRREFLAKFWSDVEHGRPGREPISRNEYLHRVHIANERYHGMSREGWQTDRGRVFISYAEPDEVERFPSSNDAKPYEIWHYNQIENGVIFVFVDRTGFGEYVLVHSTKRGELQDDQWQQYLR